MGRRKISLDIEKIKHLYQTKRMSISEIGDEMKVSYGTIRDRMVANDIPRRNQGACLYNLEPFSQRQREYLFGSLMGDDSLTKPFVTPYLQVAHSIKQKDYLMWKYNIWKDYTAVEPKEYAIEDAFDNGKTYKIIRFQTPVHPDFNYFYDLFYGGKDKHVNEEILDNVFSSPLSLAIWYMDDGNYGCNRGRIRISTQSFTLNENKLISKYFKQKLNIESRVYPIHYEEIKYYVYLNKTEAKKFIEIISPYIIGSMKYKLD